MAAAPDPTNTFVECGYCLKQNENMKMPKLLPCGHIHCSGCLDGALDARKIVECPDCEQVLNALIHSLPDAQIGTQNPQYFCDVCEKPAIIYCPEARCKMKYCSEHKKHHDALLSKHKSISIAEFSLRSKREEKRTCSVHEGQVLSFGCRRCSDILCEDCIDEDGACSGSRHTSAPLKKLYSEAKERIELLKDKVEEKKSTLSFLSKESDRVLTDYGEETERMKKLIHKTRDEQLKEINTLYESLEEEFNEKRQEMEGNIVRFKDDVVEMELSHLNTVLQRTLASLKQDHLVDVIRNGKQAERELHNGLAKELPSLRITEATGLTINENQSVINAEIRKIRYSIQIVKLPDGEPKFNLHAAHQTAVSARVSAAGTSRPNQNECPICLDELKDVEILPCSHKFCKNCIYQLVATTKSNQCPTCRYPLRNAEGDQPTRGRMTTHISPGSCDRISVLQNHCH